MHRFNIVLVRPPGYAHADALLDVGRLLHYSLDSLGVASTLSYNSFDSAATNIVLGYHLLQDASQIVPGTSILYQLEQLSDREGWFNHTRLEILRHASEVWDYAAENVRFLAAKGVGNVKLLPIGFHERLFTIASGDEDIDVLFYGSINNRRRTVLDKLAQQCKLRVLFGVYGPQRDEHISRSKIVLNVHFYETQLMEQPRISYLLNNHRFVLSEVAANNPFPNAIAVAPYDELLASCQRFLSNKPDRTRTADAGYELLRSRPMTQLLETVL